MFPSTWTSEELEIPCNELLLLGSLQVVLDFPRFSLIFNRNIPPSNASDSMWSLFTLEANFLSTLPFGVKIIHPKSEGLGFAFNAPSKSISFFYSATNL
jgi:hypothetical protein